MRTVEIARADWTQALNKFSATHDGGLVSLEILSSAIGAQPEITQLPLLGVSFEADDDGTIIIAAARTSADHITHAIQAPRRIWIERTDAGADAAVQVESADGTKAILRLKTARPA